MKSLFILICMPLAVFSQSNWEQVDASEFLGLIQGYEKNIPVGESYSLETRYTIYNDFQDIEPANSFPAKLTCRNGKELNVVQMGHVMVQDGALNITIDTAARQLLVQKADPAFFYRKTLADYSAFLEITETVFKRAENKTKIFRLDMKRGAPYRSIEFTFSENDFISQVIIYSNLPYYGEDGQNASAKAKIVLDFGKLKRGKAAISPQFMAVKDCVLLKDNQLSAIGSYQDFEVIDLRN